MPEEKLQKNEEQWVIYGVYPGGQELSVVCENRQEATEQLSSYAEQVNYGRKQIITCRAVSFSEFLEIFPELR